MRLAFYKGKGWVSTLIKWQTRGQYSHVGVLMNDGSIIESWHRGGVLWNADIGTRHDPGTEVDVFMVENLTTRESAEIMQFMKSKLGHAYDFRSVFRFITREPENPADKDKWFCSELVMAAFAAAGVKLLNVPPARVSPEVLSWSTRLVKIETQVTK